MENLKAERIIKALERDIRISMGLNYECPRITYSKLRDALALINSQEQRIKELTEENERLRAENKTLTYDNEELKNKIQEVEFTEEEIDLLDEYTRLLDEGIKDAKVNIVRKMQAAIKEYYSKSVYRPTTKDPVKHTMIEHLFYVIDQIAKEMLEGEK